MLIMLDTAISGKNGPQLGLFIPTKTLFGKIFIYLGDPIKTSWKKIIMDDLNLPVHKTNKFDIESREKCPKCGSIHTYWNKVFKYNHCAGLSFSCGYFWRWDDEN